MMINKFITIFIFLLSISTPLFAQRDSSKINFEFELRERFESWNGMNKKNYGDDSPDAIGSLNDKILFQRVIAGFVLHPTPNLDFSAHIQDSRAFGWSLRNSEYPDIFKIKEKNTDSPWYIMNPNEEFFEIHDLYIERRNVLNTFTVKAGRQKIFYGDKRIFGPGEWGNTGRWTWDAIKVSYKFSNNSIDVFGGGTKIHNPEKISIPFTQTEFWGGGFYAHFHFKEYINIEPFYAIKKPGSADYINTLRFTRNWAGMRIYKNNFFHLMYDVTVSKEFGNENGKSIDAYGVVAQIGYQLEFFPSKPIIAIRESYASGGKNTGTEIKTYEPAYGSRDSYYGRMNITSWSNLNDREIILTLFPIKKIKVECSYHWFYIPSPEDVKLLGTIQLQEGKNHLGNEFNMFAKYRFKQQFEAVGAFGYFWAGDIQPINNEMAKDAIWFTFQLHWKFNG